MRKRLQAAKASIAEESSAAAAARREAAAAQEQVHAITELVNALRQQLQAAEDEITRTKRDVQVCRLGEWVDQDCGCTGG